MIVCTICKKICHVCYRAAARIKATDFGTENSVDEAQTVIFIHVVGASG